MRLVCPCDVRAGNKSDRDPSLSRVLYQLMDRPIFEHKAHQEHEHSQGVVNDCWVDFVSAEARPYPAEEHKRRAVDEP